MITLGTGGGLRYITEEPIPGMANQEKGSGTGTQATIKLSDFTEHWHWALNNVVFPNRLK